MKAVEDEKQENEKTGTQVGLFKLIVAVGNKSQNKPVAVKRRNGYQVKNRQNQIHKDYEAKQL